MSNETMPGALGSNAGLGLAEKAKALVRQVMCSAGDVGWHKPAASRCADEICAAIDAAVAAERKRIADLPAEAALSSRDLALRFDTSAAWLLNGTRPDGPMVGAGAYLEAATRLRRQANEIEQLERENFALAAGQCAEVTADEGGTPRCSATVRMRRCLLNARSWLSKRPSDEDWLAMAIDNIDMALGPNAEFTGSPKASPSGTQG